MARQQKVSRTIKVKSRKVTYSMPLTEFKKFFKQYKESKNGNIKNI